MPRSSMNSSSDATAVGAVPNWRHKHLGVHSGRQDEVIGAVLVEGSHGALMQRIGGIAEGDHDTCIEDG